MDTCVNKGFIRRSASSRITPPRGILLLLLLYRHYNTLIDRFRAAHIMPSHDSTLWRLREDAGARTDDELRPDQILQALALRDALDRLANDLDCGNGKPLDAKGIAECLEDLLLGFDPRLIANRNQRWMVKRFVERFLPNDEDCKLVDWRRVIFRNVWAR